MFQSGQFDARFGVSVRTAGDVNGDGYDDVIVGAPGYDNEGRVFVFHGSPAGLSKSPDWIAESGQAGADFGVRAGTAGDVNGDGYDDVIVGASLYEHGQINEGRVFVFHGSPAGLSARPDWSVESDQAVSDFGNWVGTAGDVNGDGYDDVIVGAPGYSNGGRAYVYQGSPSGLSATADWIAGPNQVNAYFGTVATAGDVNGDGFDDVVVGAQDYDSGVGRAFAFHGSSSGLSTSPDWTASEEHSIWFGRSVGTAGDVNADGYDDVIVGAPVYANGQTSEGAAFAYFGSPIGLSTSPDWTAESNQEDGQFGASVATAGDVNGDGYADVLVGADFYNHPEDNEGSSFLFHGSAGGLSTRPDGMAESNEGNAQFGFSVATAGDVNGDGLADVIVGAPDFAQGGAAFVYRGAEPASP
jgi:hypothetical protein